MAVWTFHAFQACVQVKQLHPCGLCDIRWLEVCIKQLCLNRDLQDYPASCISLAMSFIAVLTVCVHPEACAFHCGYLAF